jgi:hypothetical protein
MIDLPEVLDEIHRHHRAALRFDDAIAAKRRAIAAGYRSTPDPEADIAEIYVAQGRLGDAAMLFKELRLRDPDDVWLFNSAAWAYEDVDPATSLQWALAGVDKAFETGDPDRVIGQLRDSAERAWDKLGIAPDAALIDRIEQFITDGKPKPIERPTWLAEASQSGARERQATEQTASGVPAATAWFPATEWPAAIERWPDLLEAMPADHQEYCRKIEARLKSFHSAAPGQARHVAPINVDELAAFSADRGHDPPTALDRAVFAAQVFLSGHALAWPPRRNERCWCGSGRKYKLCCGPEPSALPVSPAGHNPDPGAGDRDERIRADG